MSFSSRRMQPVDWDEIKYFRPGEFKRPELMGYEFMVWLDKVRHQAGVPMHITSSYRSEDYNVSVGGATDSAHVDIPCNAVDIGLVGRGPENYWRAKIFEAAWDNGCRRIGMYADGSMHIDRTEDRRPAPRIWRVVR